MLLVAPTSWNHAHQFWLPVLSHIPPPNLRRQEATAKLLTTIQLNDKLPLCSDINSHPSVRLLSRHPVWLDEPAPDATAASEWIDAWFNTTVVNQSSSHSSLTQPSVLLVSTYLGVCGPHWTDFELVRVDVQLILFGGIRPQTRHAYVETHDRQWIISSITVQLHDFLVVYGYYINPMKTLFHGWARKASDRSSTL